MQAIVAPARQSLPADAPARPPTASPRHLPPRSPVEHPAAERRQQLLLLRHLPDEPSGLARRIGRCARRRKRRSTPTATAPGRWSASSASSRRRPTVGEARYAFALYATGQADQAREAARRAWIGGALPQNDESRLLTLFGGTLTPADHDARIDALLVQRRPPGGAADAAPRHAGEAPAVRGAARAPDQCRRRRHASLGPPRRRRLQRRAAARQGQLAAQRPAGQCRPRPPRQPAAADGAAGGAGEMVRDDADPRPRGGGGPAVVHRLRHRLEARRRLSRPAPTSATAPMASATIIRASPGSAAMSP